MTTWPSGNRDTTEFPTVDISADMRLRTHLKGFLRLEGTPWNDYDEQREVSNLGVEDTRLRTYRKMYEQLGLIYQAGDKIKLTSLGAKIRSLEGTLVQRKEELLAAAAQDAIDILSRYQFKNPIDDRPASLPADFDVFPYWVIWKVMYELDGKLHHEELNRVVLRIENMALVGSAIEVIRRARQSRIDYAVADEARLASTLGARVVTDQPVARMASWFSIAGWGGLIIGLSSEDGFRYLNSYSLAHLKKVVSVSPIFFETNSREEWIQHYIGTNTNVPNAPVTDSRVGAQSSHSIDLSSIVDRFIENAAEANFRIKAREARRLIASLVSKRFLITTGLAGSGKTKLAQAFAAWVTPTAEAIDPFVLGAKIQSERITYFVKASSHDSVEFWNSDDETSATKVGLPRALITEWANYIAARGLSANTPAREIREAVTVDSKYSDQLHSFETHLKAAAFALLASRASTRETKHYEVVSVGADWTGSDSILGYPNALDASSYISRPALDLVLQALRNPSEPFFLILDEMNLSHVERYFADVLSAIESDEKIHLYSDGSRVADGSIVPKSVVLPNNLFIIGTVNVDETTYMFSPKVLDRANVIEFRISETELLSFLDAPTKPNLSVIGGQGEAFGHAIVEAATKSLTPFAGTLKTKFDSTMLIFFKVLSAGGNEFGYRVVHEAARFIDAYKKIGSYSHDDADWFDDAFDCVIAQKFLPKLHGSRAKLAPILKKLWFLCVNAEIENSEKLVEMLETISRSTGKDYEPSVSIPDDARFKVSAEKIGRMARLLNENGFTSFAET
jgi:hypothetical protein